jgi:hypothetical protein
MAMLATLTAILLAMPETWLAQHADASEVYVRESRQ